MSNPIIDAMMQPSPTTEQVVSNDIPPAPQSKGDGEYKNYYQNPAPAVKPNPDTTGKAIVIASDGEVPDDIMEKFSTLFKMCRERKLILSFIPDETDRVTNVALMSGTSSFTARPHKFFNENVTASLDFPSDCAQEAASWVTGNKKDGSSRFEGLPNFVRAIIAARVNTLLGKKCKEKALCCVIYTPTGTEISKDRKFELKHRRTDTLIEIAEKFNIPVFNLGNQTGSERLTTFLKSRFTVEDKKVTESPVEQPTTQVVTEVPVTQTPVVETTQEQTPQVVESPVETPTIQEQTPDV